MTVFAPFRTDLGNLFEGPLKVKNMSRLDIGEILSRLHDQSDQIRQLSKTAQEARVRQRQANNINDLFAQLSVPSKTGPSDRQSRK